MDMAKDGVEVQRIARAGWRRWLPLVILAMLAALVVGQGWHRQLDLDGLAANETALRTFVDANRPAALAAFGALYVAAVGLSLPGAVLMTVAGGFLFGWLAGGVVAVVAATIGASLVFLVARTAVGDALARRAGPRLAAFGDGFRRDALSYLLFLRLAPVFPFWLVNLAPAILGVPFATFVLATFVGIIPGTFAFAVIGSGLDSVIAAKKAARADCLAAGAIPSPAPSISTFRRSPRRGCWPRLAHSPSLRSCRLSLRRSSGAVQALSHKAGRRRSFSWRIF